MKAIILNAGKGGRLGTLTDDRPKCLVEVWGRPILDFQLDALRLAGVRELVIVVGYRHEMIRDYLKRYPEFAVTWLENPDYAETNTAYSLWLARHEMTGDFLYLNGDVLFHPELVRRLVAAPALNPLAVERKRCGEEEVKVLLEGTKVTSIGKEIDPAMAYGEFIGVARFSGSIGQLFSETLEEVVQRDKLVKNYFETAVDRMLDKSVFTSLDISDLPCIEIDFPDDLERAQTSVIPSLAG
jgi:choline kinase